jgi:hypothetical protein
MLVLEPMYNLPLYLIRPLASVKFWHTVGLDVQLLFQLFASCIVNIARLNIMDPQWYC